MLCALESVCSHFFLHFFFFLEKIECTNQNIKDALRKYANEQQDDWDVHLQAIVYGINIAKQVRNTLW